MCAQMSQGYEQRSLEVLAPVQDIFDAGEPLISSSPAHTLVNLDDSQGSDSSSDVLKSPSSTVSFLLYLLNLISYDVSTVVHKHPVETLGTVTVGKPRDCCAASGVLRPSSYQSLQMGKQMHKQS